MFVPLLYVVVVWSQIVGHCYAWKNELQSTLSEVVDNNHVFDRPCDSIIASASPLQGN